MFLSLIFRNVRLLVCGRNTGFLDFLDTDTGETPGSLGAGGKNTGSLNFLKRRYWGVGKMNTGSFDFLEHDAEDKQKMKTFLLLLRNNINIISLIEFFL
ncbi:hypothetical protein RclHR1_05560001 [Rhizophagus clarus]|uniref:Uncharacterized protein n=1 Tax=Rhizophagus clarus TaxID=94130 RepID=A0A2Z6RPI9_9GLOM|nr:hypothetical protein RclHR1_05560001 [Rhizophagus clarus]GES96873.1 hypothetical protein RCL_jg14867.t1 [Rhizophagus clarus]